MEVEDIEGGTIHQVWGEVTKLRGGIPRWQAKLVVQFC